MCVNRCMYNVDFLFLSQDYPVIYMYVYITWYTIEICETLRCFWCFFFSILRAAAVAYET